jgi:hypothetical protein
MVLIEFVRKDLLLLPAIGTLAGERLQALELLKSRAMLRR